MQHFLGKGRTGRVFHLFRLFSSEGGIAGIVVIDLDCLWTFIPE